jgi:hypothetical protein
VLGPDSGSDEHAENVNRTNPRTAMRNPDFFTSRIPHPSHINLYQFVLGDATPAAFSLPWCCLFASTIAVHELIDGFFYNYWWRRAPAVF